MLFELIFGSLLITSEVPRISGCFAPECSESTCAGRPEVYFQLLDVPLIRSELNLTAEQQTAITALEDDFLRRSLADRQQAEPAVGDRPPAIIAARSRLQRDLFDLDQSARGSLESILSDVQENRLTQVFRQWIGPELFEHENYLAPLKLSKTQSRAVNTAIAQFRYRMDRAFRARWEEQDPTDSDSERQRSSEATFQRRQRQFEEAALETIRAVLDDEQRTELESLFGKQLDRHELRRQMSAAAQARIR